MERKDWMEWLGRLRAEVRTEAPLGEHTSYRIGGPAEALVTPRDMEALKEILSRGHADQIPVRIIGGGTNLLVSDRGVRGIVITLGRGFDGIQILSRTSEGALVRAGAGARLSDVLLRAAEGGLGGLEYLAGVPGTLGGALIMNAGTATEFIGDAVVSVDVIDGEGKFWLVPGKDIEFGYRKTAFPVIGALVGAVLRFRDRPRKEVMADIRSRVRQRRDTQPLSSPSAGSVFKNPKGAFGAAELIERTGLKGLRVGGAEVSAVHANFIINRAGATATDVETLIQAIQKQVADLAGERLELEIHWVGEAS